MKVFGCWCGCLDEVLDASHHVSVPFCSGLAIQFDCLEMVVFGAFHYPLPVVLRFTGGGRHVVCENGLMVDVG